MENKKKLSKYIIIFHIRNEKQPKKQVKQEIPFESV